MTPVTTAAYQNPVYSGYFADPFVLSHEGRFYGVGTGPTESGVLPTLQSDDFANWKPGPGALIPPAGYENGDFWAPEIAFREGRFYLYYSVGLGHTGHHLRVAVSDRPEGPYRDSGHPLLDPTSTPFAIDAHPFQDADGRWHLFYARDIVEGNRPGTSLVVAPLDDPLHIGTDFHIVARANYDWQLYEKDRAMPQYGTDRYHWHTLEGPFAVPHDGKLYLLYSGGNFQNDTYGVDFLTADSVYGKYEDTNDGNAARVLRTVPNHVIGPGHNSVATGPNGIEYVVYHAWDTNLTARRLCVDPLTWTENGPLCTPTWTPQPFRT
jgi:arabinan endo-1,5-alpha-L-arabinosidase